MLDSNRIPGQTGRGVLQGEKFSEEVLAEAAVLASEKIPRVSSGFRGSADYQREMVKEILRRTGLEAYLRALAW